MKAQEKSQATLVLSSQDLMEDMKFLENLGFLLQNIYPSDNPAVACYKGHGIYITIDKNCTSPPAQINILVDNPSDLNLHKTEYSAPNGTVYKIRPKSYELKAPTTQHSFEVRKLQDSDPWVIGRAGMLYRDLIPNRLGGSIIASHIRIPKGGPVPDMVHYHTIGFQLIYCYKGWVKLVYEDQGGPFILKAGDCVTQPPEIRHCVLEASDNLEVIEIGVPADHMTTIDHELTLPTAEYLPKKTYQGHSFCHHQLKNALWAPWRIPGFEYRETGINDSTNGTASVHVARIGDLESLKNIELMHDCDILFTFVMNGTMQLDAEGYQLKNLKQGDAYVVPPNLKHVISAVSKDIELLEVSLPGNFKTTIH